MDDADDANSMAFAWHAADDDDWCIKNDAIDLKIIVQSDDEPTDGPLSIWYAVIVCIESGCRFDVLVLTSMFYVSWWVVMVFFFVESF